MLADQRNFASEPGRDGGRPGGSEHLDWTSLSLNAGSLDIMAMMAHIGKKRVQVGLVRTDLM